MRKIISKKSILFLLLSISICFISCNKDDDNSGGDSSVNNLVGTWSVVDIQANSNATGEVNAEVSGTIKFNENGTGQESYMWTALGTTFNEVNSFTWTSTSSTIVFDAGTEDETVWSREINQSNRQKGTYVTTENGVQASITVTLEK